MLSMNRRTIKRIAHPETNASIIFNYIWLIINSLQTPQYPTKEFGIVESAAHKPTPYDAGDVRVPCEERIQPTHRTHDTPFQQRQVMLVAIAAEARIDEIARPHSMRSCKAEAMCHATCASSQDERTA